MNHTLTKYYQIFASLPHKGYDNCVEVLKQELADLFISAYIDQFGHSQILEFDVNGYTYLFDLIERDSSNIEKDDRIVGVYGRVSHTKELRDSSRMKGFIGPFNKLDRYKGYDKGHFVSHKINGNLDQNLYPQLRELNRGWSKQGKLFRSFERYCEQNQDVFMFSRPIYLDDSWIPCQIDYGVFTKEFGLLINRFDNKAPI